ncbi:MAG: transcriptional regulator, MarR family [Actinomycetia bacterium]|nr:transcriptional regulator, MarR family [Actinomycetes bacterium]
MSNSPRSRPPSFDVRRLTVLREVARRGSIVAAADALNFSSSAVSHHIRALEAEAGAPLIERESRTLLLTNAGQVLVDHAESVLAQLADAEAEIKAIAGLGGGRLRLATFRSAGETIVAEAVTYFRHRFPDVRVSLREGDPEEYLSLIKGDQLDIGLTYAYDRLRPPSADGLEQVVLFEDPFWVALPSDHRRAADTCVRLEDLAVETWIASTRSSSVHRFTEKVCSDAGFAPRVRFETDDYHVAQALVATGLGVALLPRLATRVRHPDVAVRPLGGVPLVRRIIAAHRPGGDRAPAVAAMMKVLTDLSAEL